MAHRNYAFLSDELAAANPKLDRSLAWVRDPVLDIWQSANGHVVMGPIARGDVDEDGVPIITGTLDMKIDLDMLK